MFPNLQTLNARFIAMAERLSELERLRELDVARRTAACPCPLYASLDRLHMFGGPVGPSGLTCVCVCTDEDCCGSCRCRAGIIPEPDTSITVGGRPLAEYLAAHPKLA